MFKPVFCAVALLILASCASPIPRGAVGHIAVDQVRTAPPDTPQTIRWGGTITSVQNLKDGRTTIEIVSRPLTASGRPRHNDRTDGRFIAEVTEILDPAIIKPGRDITVVGLVGKVLREGTIGKTPYAFPVVNVEDYHFWAPPRQYTRSYCYGCEYGFGIYSDGYNFFGFKSGFHIGHHGHYGYHHGFRWHHGF